MIELGVLVILSFRLEPEVADLNQFLVLCVLAECEVPLVHLLITIHLNSDLLRHRNKVPAKVLSLTEVPEAVQLLVVFQRNWILRKYFKFALIVKR